jgi:hypothetical protein
LERIKTINNVSLDISHHADTCNHCNHAIVPEFISANLVGESKKRGTNLEIVYLCTKKDCARLFISTYRRTASRGSEMINEFKFISSIPSSSSKPNVPNAVGLISPSFLDIYFQSHLAEKYELNEIAGVGYRKALEFLIKDYCISNNEDATENIKKLQLAKVIGQYVADVNIQNCAKRAVWLGNDETHYVKKWDDKDISDLKILITLTIGWVNNCLLTKQYIEEMS